MTAKRKPKSDDPEGRAGESWPEIHDGARNATIEENERLRAAAELARKRLLDVVRNGDAEPEDMEAYEALDWALKDKQ